MPKVIVGMPAYNAEARIASAIEAIQRQTYEDFTLIISDNASTDATESICRRYASSDSRIRYRRQPENRGAIANYNYLASLADSDYFKWQASNDTCSETLLADCIGAMESDPGIVIAYPQTWLVFDDVSPPERYDDRMEAVMPSAVDRFFHVIDNMRLNNVLNGVIRASALRHAEPHGEFFFADRNLVAELALYGTLKLVDSAAFYRGMDRESATRLKSPEDLQAHHNPARRRPPVFSNWRIYLRYGKALLRSDLDLPELAGAQRRLLRRIWWAREDLSHDIGDALQNVVVDARGVFGRRVQEK